MPGAAVACAVPAGLDALDAEAVLHDIRGYLTIIRGQCHGVVRDGSASAATIDRLRSIDDQVARIDAAVARVRDSLRDGASPDHEWFPIDLRRSVSRAIVRLDGAARSRGVTIRTVSSAVPMTVLGAGDLIDRALDNVLLNAVRGAGYGGDVGVALDVADETVSVCVTNDVAPAAADVSDGWGVGLQIVRSIVRSHRGELTLTVDGRRATVWVVLPSAGVLAGERSH